MHVQWAYIVVSTAQTDLGLRSRTVSLKLNGCIHFLKSLKSGTV